MNVVAMTAKSGNGVTALAAKQYLARGWRTIPVPFKSKGPTIKGWQHLQITDADLSGYFADTCNIRVVLGASNLTDVDVDAVEANHFLDWLPASDAVWGRNGNPSSHRLYLGARQARTFKTKSLGMIIEIRSHGCQSLLPPSVHPEGHPYTWECEGDPGSGDGLDAAVTKIAIATVLLTHWAKGCCHELALATAGLLLKAGWPADAVSEFVVKVATVGGDSEIDDRVTAVDTTAQLFQKGAPVAGFSNLKDLIGLEDADAIASWVNVKSDDLGERASRPRLSVKEKREIALSLRKNLQSRGTFYRVQGTGELLFFHKVERELYGIGSVQFRALCNDIYDINGKEPVWAFIEEALLTYCTRHGEPTEVYRVARYQNQKLYIHAGGHQVLRLDGESIQTIDNGDDGILFQRTAVQDPIEPNFEYSGSPLYELLVCAANATEKDRLALYHIYIYTVFFESLLPTKPIVLLTGPKGSGKTSAGRALKHVIHGYSASVDTGLTDRSDALWAAACNSTLLCIDNVDSLVPWLADAVAVLSTGGTFNRRKLYETNTLVEYTPHCFLMITSRNPQSFTRDDVVDRLLLIEVERRQDFLPESQLLQALKSRRGEIWGELSTNLNKMVDALKKPLPKKMLAHRLADWAQLALVFAPILGIADIEDKLTALEKSKVNFALDDDPVAKGLEEWVDENPDHQFIASGALFQAINNNYEMKGQKFAIKTARVFGIQLKHLPPELSTRYKIEEKPGPNNTKMFRFAKFPDGQFGVPFDHGVQVFDQAL